MGALQTVRGVHDQMEDTNRIGILLEGIVQAKKPSTNGSQVNVSVRRPEEIIGAAAAFSKEQNTHATWLPWSPPRF